MNQRTFVLVAFLALFVSIAPILIAAYNRQIPNAREYWHNIYDMEAVNLSSSKGYYKTEQDGITIGNLSSDRPSEVSLLFGFWQGVYFNKRAQDASEAILSLSLERPVSSFINFEPKEVGWTANYSDWEEYATSIPAEINVSGGILNMSTRFNGKNRVFNLLKSPLLNVSTSNFSFLLVKWQSTDHIARLELQTLENEYKVIVESADGTIYPGTYGGGYVSVWTETFLILPPNETVTRIVLGLDSGGGGGGSFPVSGYQHVLFDKVILASVEVAESSSVRIQFNNTTIFQENLLSRLEENYYTVDTAKYPEKIIQLTIPINTSDITLNNYLRVSVGPETELKLLIPYMSMNTYFEKIEKPYLAEVSLILVVVGTAGGLISMTIVASTFLKRMYRYR